MLGLHVVKSSGSYYERRYRVPPYGRPQGYSKTQGPGTEAQDYHGGAGAGDIDRGGGTEIVKTRSTGDQVENTVIKGNSMAFTAISKILKDSGRPVGGRGISRGEAGVYLSTHKGIKSINGVETWQTCIRMSKEVCDEARFIKGDRVAFDIDRDARLMRIRRVSATSDETSWALSGSNGKINRSLVVKFTWVPGLPSFTSPKKGDYVVDNDGVTVEIPVDCGWAKCARTL